MFNTTLSCYDICLINMYMYRYDKRLELLVFIRQIFCDKTSLHQCLPSNVVFELDQVVGVDDEEISEPYGNLSGSGQKSRLLVRLLEHFKRSR